MGLQSRINQIRCPCDFDGGRRNAPGAKPRRLPYTAGCDLKPELLVGSGLRRRLRANGVCTECPTFFMACRASAAGRSMRLPRRLGAGARPASATPEGLRSLPGSMLQAGNLADSIRRRKLHRCRRMQWSAPDTSGIDRATIRHSMTLVEFARTHPPQLPRIPSQNPDQDRLLGIADGVFSLADLPVDNPVFGARGTPEGRYLWVISVGAIPAILETAPRVQPPLQSAVAKHTNLTGGDPACCGGELWLDVVAAERLHVTGASGRYPPRSPEELANAVSVLREIGFVVESAGWDTDNERPARVFR